MDIGGIIGGVGGIVGQSVADYDVARRLQHDSQDYQSEFAQKRYQYMVKDLQKAGINPMLAIGGATAPSGGGGGIVSPPRTGNAFEAATSGAKVIADTKNTEQATKESEQRTALLGQQTASASAKAVQDSIDAQKATATFNATDQTDFGKKIMPVVNNLPPWLQGVARWGLTTAKNTSDSVSGMWDKYKLDSYQKDLNNDYKNKKYNENKNSQSVIDSAVRKLNEGRFRPSVGSDGGVNFSERK